LEREPYTIRRLTGLTDDQLHALALVLIGCVEGGASVSFMHMQHQFLLSKARVIRPTQARAFKALRPFRTTY
jgi:hypothetical protein